jgi:gamma-glutamyltranspeptidase/glutathione hydrolase
MNFTPPPHLTQNWHITKPSATGKRGIVVSQARPAAQAGIAILEAGGNAIDAAVGTALALTSQEPWNSGIGGIGFCVVHRAGEKNAQLVDFGPVSPRHTDPAQFKLTGRMTTDLFAWAEVENDANIHGPISMAIPSSTAGYEKLHSTWGRMPIKDVMAPAVALAKRGLPQDWYTALKLALSASVLAKYEESARIYLRDGLPPLPPYQGTTGFFRQGNLPDTLERLQHAGLRDYYEGDLAKTLVEDFRTVGSHIDAEDLRNCQARILPTTDIPWRNGRTLQLATGLTAAPTLTRVLEQMRAAPWGAKPDAAWFRALARIMKSAYADRLAGLGEADRNAAETCTTHLTVCDQEGTMVAMTTTLMSSMGSRVVLPKSGVLINNGMMWFDPRPGQPNSVAPGKRPLCNMCPIVMKQDDKPILAIGASGGRRILGSVFQVLSFYSDFGMSVEDAAHHPRIDVSSADGASADQRLDPAIIAGLAADGPLEVVEHGAVPINFACPNVIVSHKDGTRTGISDVASPWSAAIAQ